MSKKRKEPSPPAAPKPSPQEQELTRLQTQFYTQQAPAQQAAQQAQTQLLTSLIQPAQELGQQRAQLLQPLLAGEAPSGIFGRLARPVTAEEESYKRGRERLLSSLSGAGLLDSGVRAELETKLASQVTAQTEQMERADLANLLNVALGGTGTAISEITGLGGQPIQTGMAGGQVAGQTLSGQAQRVAGFNKDIYMAQLQAAEQEKQRRNALWIALMSGAGETAKTMATAGAM